MKRKAALVFALCLLILANRPIHAAQPENSLETIKENVEKMNVNPEELAKKAQKLYEEYEVLHQAAVELYATGETDQRCPRCGARLTQFQDDGYECMVQCPCGMSYRHNILD